MAKTIHDLAVEYGKVNYIVRYTADGEKEIDEDTGSEFFEDGANAVLEEIDNFIFNTIQMTDVIEPHLILIKIKKKFKELKGE